MAGKRRVPGLPGRSVQPTVTGALKIAVYIKSCPQKLETKVTKTKTALKQETYNLSDPKHDLHCGFVELGDSGLGLIVVTLIVTNTIGSESNNSKFTTIALSPP